MTHLPNPTASWIRVPSAALESPGQPEAREMPREPAPLPTEVLRTPPITSTTPPSPQPTGWEHSGHGCPTGGQVKFMALVLPTSNWRLGPLPLRSVPATSPALAPAPRTLCGRFPPRRDVPAARAQVPEPPVGTAWQPGPFPARSAAPRLRPAPLRSPEPRPAPGAYPCWRLRGLPATGGRGVQVGGIRAKVLLPVTRFPGPAQHLCGWRCAGGAAGLHPRRRWNGRGTGRRPLSPRGGTPVSGPHLDSAPAPGGRQGRNLGRDALA